MPTLTWLTREEDLKAAGRAPYRLLEPVETYGDPATKNMLIQWDNLEALKALLPYYAGKVSSQENQLLLHRLGALTNETKVR